MSIDNNTKRNIAAALWMDQYDEKMIDAKTLLTINSEKNSPDEFGARMKNYLTWLADNPQSNNPNYTKRYSLLNNLIGALNPQQAYVIHYV